MTAAAPGFAQAGPETLEKYAWACRPLLIFSSSQELPEFIEQQRALQQAGREFLDRDMVVIEIVGKDVRTVAGPEFNGTAESLHTTLGIGPDQFAVVLVGKDTGIKLRAPEPVTTSEIFSLIDTMPMRRREILVQDRSCKG